MPDPLAALLGHLKQTPAHFAVVFLASGALLFIPWDGLGKIGTAAFVRQYEGWLMVCFTLSTCALLVFTYLAIQKVALTLIRVRRLRIQKFNSLHSLDLEEKRIMAKMLISSGPAQLLVGFPVSLVLVEKRLIRQISSGHVGHYSPFVIDEYAQKILDAHPELLK